MRRYDTSLTVVMIAYNESACLGQFELPMKVAQAGGKIGEVVVDCKPRLAGESKVANIGIMCSIF